MFHLTRKFSALVTELVIIFTIGNPSNHIPFIWFYEIQTDIYREYIFLLTAARFNKKHYSFN